MIKFKHNYFLRNCVDMDKSIKDYLLEAEFNYVIFDNGEPLVWAGDNTPVIFGDKDSIDEELENDINEDGTYKDYIRIMTEFEFICEYCTDALEKVIHNAILVNGEKDGNSFNFYLDNLNGVIDIAGIYTDILFAHIGEDNMLTIFISDDKDECQSFVSLGDLNSDVIFDIVYQIL